MAFSATGATAVTAGEDKRAIVWDVRRAVAIDTLAGHSGQLTGLAISRDGRTLYTSALDGKVLVWDLAGDRRLGRPFPTGRDAGDRQPDLVGSPGSLPASPEVMTALSPDGRTLAVGHLDGTVTLVDARTLLPRLTVRVVAGWRVAGIGFEPETGLLLASDGDGSLAFVDPRTGTIVRRERAGIAVHAELHRRRPADGDGRQQGAVRLWTLRAGLPAGRPRVYYPTGTPTRSRSAPTDARSPSRRAWTSDSSTSPR